jgi:predicted Zn-dependent peptidase
MKHSVEEIKLKSGAKGLLIDVEDATVMSIQFHFRAGNRYVKDKDIYETAHVMEHMAFGENGKYSSQFAYEQEFTKNGAYHNAFTTDYSMVYETACADFEWDRILDLQRVAITSPKFNNEELDAESKATASEAEEIIRRNTRAVRTAK